MRAGNKLPSISLSAACGISQAQADALHVTMPEATTLAAALDRLDNFQQRAKEYLRCVIE